MLVDHNNIAFVVTILFLNAFCALQSLVLWYSNCDIHSYPMT